MKTPPPPAPSDPIEEVESAYAGADAPRVIPYGVTFRFTAMIFWGVVAPVVFLIAAATYGPFDSVWQSGEWGDYALLLFRWPSLRLVYPFLLFSEWKITELAWSPEKHRRSGWTLLGVATGALIWWELWLVWSVSVAREFSGPTSFTFSLLSPIAIGFGVLPWVLLRRLSLKIGEFEQRLSIVLLALVFVLFIVSQGAFAGGYFMACLIWATPAATLVYLWATWECLQTRFAERFQFSLKVLLAIFAWVSLHLASWRFAVNSMMTLYHQTPTENPSNCFVATAAAQGHRRFVGGMVVHTPGGETRQVTRQLQRLKAMELALLAAAPGAHRGLRAIYNRVGPPVASALCRPTLADLAYLALKPAEWFARWVVLPLAGVKREQVRRLYAGEDGKR